MGVSGAEIAPPHLNLYQTYSWENSPFQKLFWEQEIEKELFAR